MWSKIKKYGQNFLGPTIDKKYIIIESDDWGSVRMPSKKIYEELRKSGHPVDNNPFTKFDSLESNDDLENLFFTLSNHKDSEGRHPIITANTIMANPNFEKIIATNYTKYEFEPFTETLNRYPAHDRVMDLYKAGVNSGMIHLEYHGREHVNINLWMSELKNQNSVFRQAAKLGTFAIDITSTKRYKQNFMATCHFENSSENYSLQNDLLSGLNLFSQIFGYKAKSFIAPSYIWDSMLEESLAKNGIESIQGLSYQYIPQTREKYKKKFHYLGQINKWKQIYLIRNAFFEPSIIPNIDWVNKCMKDIEIAFRMKKPAIIGSHRINYIGSIDSRNSFVNLKLLNSLLSQILKNWPDVQFITSAELTDLLHKKLTYE